MGSRSPRMISCNFGRKVRPLSSIGNFCHSCPETAVPNPSICRLCCGLGSAKGSTSSVVFARCCQCTRRHSTVSCAKTSEPIILQFGLWTRVSRRKHEFNHIHQVAPMCPHGMAHWYHLANTIKSSTCGGDAVLCQITLTTCLHFFLSRVAVWLGCCGMRYM